MGGLVEPEIQSEAQQELPPFVESGRLIARLAISISNLQNFTY